MSVRNPALKSEKEIGKAFADKKPRAKPKTKIRGKGFLFYLKRDYQLYLLLLPAIVIFVIYKYIPMLGNIIAFKDFKFSDGILGSSWVGLEHFERLFTSDDFYSILKNTLVLSMFSIVFAFPMPIILALMLNEVKNVFFKKTIQSIVYIPHFISWVVLGGIVISLLSPTTGVVNKIITLLGGEAIYFMKSTFWWRVVYVLSEIWQGAGWGSIIYLAAITGVDGGLYEAAKIDGAGKLQCIWNITLPCIRSTICIMLILRLGKVMEIGFEQVYALQNDAVRSVSEVISTYEYRIGLQGMQYSYTTALGIFKSVISLILVLGTNKVINLMGEEGLW